MSTILVVTIKLPRRSTLTINQARTGAKLMLEQLIETQLDALSNAELKLQGGIWYLRFDKNFLLRIPPEDLVEELERLTDCLIFISLKDLKKAKAALDKTSHKVIYFQSDGIGARREGG